MLLCDSQQLPCVLQCPGPLPLPLRTPKLQMEWTEMQAIIHGQQTAEVHPGLSQIQG